MRVNKKLAPLLSPSKVVVDRENPISRRRRYPLRLFGGLSNSYVFGFSGGKSKNFLGMGPPRR